MEKICIAEECENKIIHQKYNLCNAHYKRMKNYGDYNYYPKINGDTYRKQSEITKNQWKNGLFNGRVSNFNKKSKYYKKFESSEKHKKNVSVGMGGKNKISKEHYNDVHKWAKNNIINNHICDICLSKKAKKYYYANKSQEYLYEIEDWFILCNQCHQKYDIEYKLNNSRTNIIYLFGSDASGKTTLAREIQDISKGNIIHGTYNKYWNMKHYHTCLIEAASIVAKYQPTVLDRWAIDEHIYGKVFRNGESYNTKKLIDKHKKYITFVYCRPSDIIERFEKLKKHRDEMFDEMAGVVKEFDEYVENSNFKIHTYDLTKDNMHQFAIDLLNIRRRD